MVTPYPISTVFIVLTTNLVPGRGLLLGDHLLLLLLPGSGGRLGLGLRFGLGRRPPGRRRRRRGRRGGLLGRRGQLHRLQTLKLNETRMNHHLTVKLVEMSLTFL